MDREHIIREIQRTAKANGGLAPGWRRFQEETGIRYHDWFGQYWKRWSDAVCEAGCKPNRMTVPHEQAALIERLVLLTRELGQVPTIGDLLLAAKKDPTFPSETAFRRLGRKHQRANYIITYCEQTPGYDDVANLWRKLKISQLSEEDSATESTPPRIGYVYLLQHGLRREYKIGRTNNLLRREGEIRVQLPEKLEPVHYIKTDDPAGIESYWHTRFASKRKEGEWFTLTPQDVAAFKKWKRIY